MAEMPQLDNVAPMPDLTEKQKRFVAEYLIDLNATQAAIRAGYSPKTAKSVGSENLTKPDIAAAIAKFQQKVAKKAEISIQSLADELEEARAIAIADRASSAAVAATMGKAKLFGLIVEKKQHSGPNGGPIPVNVSQLTDDQLAALEAIFGPLAGGSGDDDEGDQG